MNESTMIGHEVPADITSDAEVLAFRGQFEGKSPLDELVREGARRLLPAYLRQTDTIEERIPWLYLKGISTNDFGETLQALVGERAKGLSPNVIVKL